MATSRGGTTTTVTVADGNSPTSETVESSLQDEPFEGETQLYETAFPPLETTTAGPEEVVSKGPSTSARGPSSSGANHSLPLFASVTSSTSSNVYAVPRSTITEAFVICHEERRFQFPGPDSDHNQQQHHQEKENREAERAAARQRQLLSDVASRWKVSVETHTNRDGSLTVFVTGHQNIMAEAKRQLLRALQTQTTIQVSIPREYFKALIGAKASNLHEIENQTSTKVYVPRPDEPSDVISITGPKEGVEQARQLIQDKADQLAKVGFERYILEKRFHHLVCGSSNTALHAYVQLKKLRLSVPPPVIDKDEIVLSGDKEGVHQAISIIRQTYEHMKRICTSMTFEVSHEKHKFIAGPRYSGITEILNETGIQVELPPANSDSNTITLFGPTEKLGPALTKVILRAESVAIATVPAPGWLHKFVIGKKGKNLVALTDNKPELSLYFDSANNVIRIEGPPEQVSQVTTSVRTLVTDLQQRISRVEVEVEPGHIKQLIAQGNNHVARIRRETGCSIDFPAADTSDRLIRIEGSPAGVEKAKEQLLKSIAELVNTKTKDVILDHTYIPQVIGKGGKGIEEILSQAPHVRINFPTAESGSDIITLRGPREEVDIAAKALKKRHQDVLESNYSQSILVPRQFHFALIGKEGAVIREIRTETNTRIDVPGPQAGHEKITVTGRKADVEKAIVRIQAIYNKQANLVELEMEVAPHLHTILIGRGGQRINELRESCGGQVTIRFPEASTGSRTVLLKGPKDQVRHAQAKLADMVTEAAEANYEEIVPAAYMAHPFIWDRLDMRKIRDELKVRVLFPGDVEDRDAIRLAGVKRAVLEARQLVDATIKEIGEIISESVRVDPQWHAHLRQRPTGPGADIHVGHLSDTYGVKISLPKSKEDPWAITVKGPSEKVHQAVAKIQATVDRLANTVEEQMIITYRHRQSMLERCKSEVHQLCAKFNVEISIPPLSHALVPEPRPGTNDHQTVAPVVCNGGNSSGAEETGHTHEQTSNEKHADLSPAHKGGHPTHHNGLTNGGNLPNGDLHDSALSDVSSTTSSLLPLSANNTERQFLIRLKGLKQDIDKVKAQLPDFCPVDLQVEAPSEFHRALIGAGGRVIDELRRKHGVIITIPETRSGSNTSSNKSAVDANSVKVTGLPQAVRAASQDISDRITQFLKEKEDRVERNYSRCIIVAPQFHRLIIGPRGETVAGLRQKHGVGISVPDPSSNSSKVEIKGYKKNVDGAAEEIGAMVKKLESHRTEELVVEPDLHPQLIGARGANLDRIKRMFDVEIVFPPRHATGEEASIVRVTGEPDAVDKCCDCLINEAYVLMEARQRRKQQQQPNEAPSGGAGVSEDAELRPRATFSLAQASGLGTEQDMPPAANSGSGSQQKSTRTKVGKPGTRTGFSVRDAPWEQENNSRQKGEKLPYPAPVTPTPVAGGAVWTKVVTTGGRKGQNQ